MVTITYEGIKIEVTQEVADFLEQDRLEMRRQREWDRRHLSNAPTDNEEEPIELKMLNKPIGIDNLIVDSMTNQVVRDAIQKIPHKIRERVIQYYFLGMTYRQIAKQEGKDESTIRESIKKGLKQIREILTESGEVNPHRYIFN